MIGLILEKEKFMMTLRPYTVRFPRP